MRTPSFWNFGGVTHKRPIKCEMLHRELTLCCVGDVGVGKSSLLGSLCSQGAALDPEADCLFTSQVLEFKVDASFTCQVTLRNTSGGEALPSMLREALGGCDGVLVCFSLADMYSFESAGARWLQEARQLAGNKDVPILLVGTKLDKKALASSRQSAKPNEARPASKRFTSVPLEEAQALVKKQQLVGFVETSARNGKQVNDVVTAILSSASQYKFKRLQQSAASPKVSLLSRLSLKLSRTNSATSNNASTSNNNSLVDAAGSGNKDLVLDLLAKGAQASFANAAGGMSALHAAAKHGHPEVVNVLLYAGATLELRDGTGASALHLACFNGHIECVRALLDKGADIHAINLVHSTALHEAASGGHVDICALLLQRGANPKAVDLGNHTPQHRAAFAGNHVLAFFTQ
ncbi:hypothetical protein BASA81_012827 [Batrachochytrium salamandrivorans]|nr:hypothetical protein BASA81_012827 [Batrachochytrium salamandrivorans]